MIETIQIILEIGTSLLSLKSFFINSKRKKEISEWLYELGSNVEDLAHYLENNQYPNNCCQRMTIVYDDLHTIVGDAITNKDEENLKDLIRSCLNIERLYYEYINLDEPNKIDCVQELHSIAGSILGMADTLKYQK